jgi:hypothetical protein
MNWIVIQAFDGIRWRVVDLVMESEIAQFVNKMDADLFAETMNAKFPTKRCSHGGDPAKCTVGYDEHLT